MTEVADPIKKTEETPADIPVDTPVKKEAKKEVKKVKDIWHDAFYKFVHLEEPEVVLEHLRELSSACTGSILVATEGINGMIAGTIEQLDVFREHMANDAVLEGKFSDMTYKRTPCKSKPFHKMRVRLKAEIVPLRVEGVDATSQTGTDLSPQEWRELLKKDNLVLIDNRNDYEYRLGKFKGAVNPNVNNFREFPDYIKENLPKWQEEGKEVAMYCTGGIRCEKTSAWMLDLGMNVYQLEGGILNYFKEIPDAEQDWEGECFVFDNRIALDTKLEETDTTIDDVYDPLQDDDWRIQRAQDLWNGALVPIDNSSVEDDEA